jgi:hypothetical protein
MWSKYPKYLTDAFIKSFCTDNLPERLTTQEWYNLMCRLRCDIVKCVCGKEDFVTQFNKIENKYYECPRCGSKYHSMYFSSTDISIPIVDGSLIHECLLNDKAYAPQNVIGEILENKIKANLYGLKNVSRFPWKFKSADSEKDINKGEVALILEGSTLTINNCQIEFDKIDE